MRNITVTKFHQSKGASSVKELIDRIKVSVEEQNKRLYSCDSICYRSSFEQNCNYSEAKMEFIRQTCIHFNQTVKYLEADNMDELAEKIEKLTKEMREKVGYVCTCMQTQSDFGIHSSFSTAIMIFTKQYP